MARIDFGLMLRQNDPGHSLDELIEYNQRCIHALSSGFTTLWLEDHLQVEGTDALERLSTLSFLAGAYPQFKIGTLVLSQSYRNPALVAKMAANLQALSRGRFILGVGTGWKEDEHLAYGYSFPSAKTRLDELEEAVQIMKAMWTTKPATFEGKHYRIKGAYCEPQPLSPFLLLIGGGGEQRTLALVARYAVYPISPHLNILSHALFQISCRYKEFACLLNYQIRGRSPFLLNKVLPLQDTINS